MDDVKSNLLRSPAPVGLCPTAAQSARVWTGQFTKISVPAHRVLGAKNTSNEANSGTISSTEKKVRDKEEIEEGNNY